jgi:hypothetical protein
MKTNLGPALEANDTGLAQAITDAMTSDDVETGQPLRARRGVGDHGHW